MGRMQRNKGKVGERELVRALRDLGLVDSHRGQQFRGGGDSPDVVAGEGLHLECKRVERLHLWGALDQATSDAAEGAIPVVAHRCNKRPWVVILRLDDAVKAAEALLRLIGRDRDGAADTEQGAAVGA